MRSALDTTQVRRRKRAHHELSVGFDHNRLDDFSTRDVLGVSEIGGGVSSLVAAETVVDPHLIEIVLYIHHSNLL